MTASESKWYINVSGSSSTDNGIYMDNRITWNYVLLVKLLPELSSTDFQTIEDLEDRIYRYRYVIPSDVGIAVGQTTQR
jgi:hypothetical protein